MLHAHPNISIESTHDAGPNFGLCSAFTIFLHPLVSIKSEQQNNRLRQSMYKSIKHLKLQFRSWKENSNKEINYNLNEAITVI
jgi:hypothetical protein